jgi:catechol 2,3-dioxygenase-like lactoylglutathione lyase family enzyme
MKVKHVDHVGIIVYDLTAAKDFFIGLGFSAMGEEMTVEGEWVERVVGLEGVKQTVIMLQAPDGQLNLELIKFQQPEDSEGIRPGASNTLGLRHIAFVVDDIEGAVAMLSRKGNELIGEIQNYQDIWRLCYVRGPEGIIVELAEQL